MTDGESSSIREHVHEHVYTCTCTCMHTGLNWNHMHNMYTCKHTHTHTHTHTEHTRNIINTECTCVCWFQSRKGLMRPFSDGETRVLVCTDLASRGIDNDKVCVCVCVCVCCACGANLDCWHACLFFLSHCS